MEWNFWRSIMNEAFGLWNIENGARGVSLVFSIVIFLFGALNQSKMYGSTLSWETFYTRISTQI